MLRKKKKKKKSNRSRYLSTGSTVLNLACSDNPLGGLLKGHYYNYTGDTSSGKTMLTLTTLAEAAISPYFKDHALIFDNVERGALMDFRKFFGRLADRLLPPAGTRAKPQYSETIEEFYFNIQKNLEEGPMVYILDSMDSLETAQDRKKAKQARREHEEGKDDGKGNYGLAKAKKNSEMLRMVVSKLEKTDSILIIISQTRDNLAFGFETRTRAGGRALGFYATMEIWSSVKGKIKKTVRGKSRQVGINARFVIKKNRQSGKNREVIIPIYYSFGIDDLGSCIDFLLDEKHWKESRGVLTAPEFDFKGRKEKLIAQIETDEAQEELHQLVAEVWTDIEDACTVKRESRYG